MEEIWYTNIPSAFFFFERVNNHWWYDESLISQHNKTKNDLYTRAIKSKLKRAQSGRWRNCQITETDLLHNVNKNHNQGDNVNDPNLLITHGNTVYIHIYTFSSSFLFFSWGHSTHPALQSGECSKGARRMLLSWSYNQLASAYQGPTGRLYRTGSQTV